MNDNVQGSKIVYVLVQLLNFSVSLLGFAFLLIGIFLYIQVKTFYSIILVFFYLFFFILFITIVGCYTRYSLIISTVYIIINVLIFGGISIFYFYIFSDRFSLVEYLSQNIKGSNEYMTNFKRTLMDKFEVIEVLLLTYLILYVLILFISRLH